MLFLVRDSRDDSLKRFTINEYNRFITTYNLEKSKMRKTCKKLYEGNDGRNWHKGFRLEDIIDENLEQELEKSSRLGGVLSPEEVEMLINPVPYVDLGRNYRKSEENKKKNTNYIDGLDCYKCLLIADLHFDHQDDTVISIIKHFYDKHKQEISEICYLGDELDLNSISKFKTIVKNKDNPMKQLTMFVEFSTYFDVPQIRLGSNHIDERLSKYVEFIYPCASLT